MFFIFSSQFDSQRIYGIHSRRSVLALPLKRKMMGCSGDAAPTKKCHLSIFQSFHISIFLTSFRASFCPPRYFFNI